jgi:hypothetical protein
MSRVSRRSRRSGTEHSSASASALLSATLEERRMAVLRPDTPVLAILALARSPRTETELLEALAQSRMWVRHYDIVRALCFQPRLPLKCGLTLIQRLYALDLVHLLGQARIVAALREAAGHLLRTRMETLTPGERLGLARNARGAAAGVLLEREREPRVLAALLDNPALRELDVVRFVRSGVPQAEALATVGRHTRWPAAYRVRLALVQNPRTPLDSALPLVESLLLGDLRDTASDARLSSVLRLVARRYFQEKQGRGPFRRP